MCVSLRALSALLTYPTSDLQAGIGDIRAALADDGLVDPASLSTLLSELAFADLIDMQERYVDLFDKTRRLSLHLFEHVHGESRDRGQAMVDLGQLYEAAGLEMAANELPDYLPLFLEFLSTRPLDEAKSHLGNAAHILAALEGRLVAKGSPYAAVFTALVGLAASDTVVAEVATPEDGVDDLASLDAEWAETAVTFGPGDAFDGCSVDRLKIQMRAGQRDVRRVVAGV